MRILLLFLILFSLLSCKSDPFGEEGKTKSPIIVKQPSSQTVGIGGSAQFSIDATGSDTLVYQWMRGESFIFGASNSEYTIESVVKSDSGAQFRCIVMNAHGVDTSETVELHVSEKGTVPEIIQEPKDQSTVVSGSVTFSLSATGGALKYQWLKDGVALVDSDSASYSLSSVTLADSGSAFQCIVSNSLGLDTSESVILHVYAYDGRPIITEHPVDSSVPLNGVAVFSVTVLGENIYYQWLMNGELIPGGTQSELSIIVEDQSFNNAQFTCVAYNAHGADTSQIALLHVTSNGDAPTIYKQPIEQYVQHGDNGMFYVLANGDNLHFQWYKNGESLLQDTLNHITISSAHKDDSGAVYHCVVFNMHGVDTSDAVLLHVTGEKSPTAIVGMVTSWTGNFPLSDVLVRLYSSNDTTGNALDSVISNANGQFVFEELEPGQYNIWATKEGEAAYNWDVIVIDEQTTEVNSLKMCPAKSYYFPIIKQPQHSHSLFTYRILGTPVQETVTSDGFLKLDNLVTGCYKLRVYSTSDDYPDLIDSLFLVYPESSDTLHHSPISLIYTGIPVIEGFSGSFNKETLEMKLRWSKTEYAHFDAYCIFKKESQQNSWPATPEAVIPVTSSSHPLTWSETLESKDGNYEYRICIRTESGELGPCFATVSVQ